ncbi:MAG: SDR family oxidoreductase [Chloroflexota bacterium]
MTDTSAREGRVAVITGAAGAIGSAMVERFISEGVAVVAVDLVADGLTGLADRVAGSSLLDTQALDVTDEEAVDALFAGAIERHGRVDYLVNNAGITRDATIHKMSVEQWRDVLRVNLEAPWLMTRAFVRHVRDRKDGGAVVNIASISGQRGNFGQANYASSKAGIVSLTKVTAREISRYQARANAISPGFIVSPMTDAIPDGEREERAASAPLGRAGQPSEIASVAYWLCSDGSSFVTGAVIDATGGRGM